MAKGLYTTSPHQSADSAISRAAEGEEKSLTAKASTKADRGNPKPSQAPFDFGQIPLSNVTTPKKKYLDWKKGIPLSKTLAELQKDKLPVKIIYGRKIEAVFPKYKLGVSYYIPQQENQETNIEPQVEILEADKWTGVKFKFIVGESFLSKSIEERTETLRPKIRNSILAYNKRTPIKHISSNSLHNDRSAKQLISQMLKSYFPQYSNKKIEVLLPFPPLTGQLNKVKRNKEKST